MNKIKGNSAINWSEEWENVKDEASNIKDSVTNKIKGNSAINWSEEWENAKDTASNIKDEAVETYKDTANKVKSGFAAI